MEKSKKILSGTLLALMVVGIVVATVSIAPSTTAHPYGLKNRGGDTPRNYLMSILTEEQKEILEAKMQELWDSGASPQEVHKEMRATLEEILTEEQNEALFEKMEEMKETRREMRGEFRETLDEILTEEQKDILEAKMKELWKSGAGCHEIRKEMRDTLEDLLTEEQKEALSEEI